MPSGTRDKIKISGTVPEIPGLGAYDLYSLGLYNRQYRVPVASDNRGRDSSLFSSLEDRRQRPTLLLHINRRKVEAFIHSVIIFHWPLCLQQLNTSDYR